MILRELVNCHAARVAAPDADRPMPPLGWSAEKISLLATLTPDGKAAKLEPLGENEKGEAEGRMMVVPGPVLRGSNKDAARLWDKPEYALGVKVDDKGAMKETPELLGVFRRANLEIFGGADDPALRAFCAFLDSWNSEKGAALARDCGIDWKKVKGANVAFAVGAGGFLHEIPAARAAWDRCPLARACWIPPKDFEKSRAAGRCMVADEEARVPLTHPKIKGVPGAQSSGASLVSFDKPAFTSHRWTQNENAPVGEAAAFQYAAALNWLLRHNRVNLPGTAVVFWAETPDAAEDELRPHLGGAIPEGEDDASLREKLDAMRRGKLPAPIERSADARFFVLGLAPNAGRVAVRFWHESTVGDLWKNIRRHCEDLEIVSVFPDPKPQTPYRLMSALAAPGKDGLPGNFAAEFFRAVLSGGRHPAALLSQVIARVRAGSEPWRDRDLAALVKAFLIRNHNRPPEASPMLNEQSQNPAYNLGRLFAALETAQLAANNWKKPNASIRDKYIAAFPATPARIYPVLMGLANKAHLSAEKAGWLNPVVDDIHRNLPDELPAVLTLEEQGKFFLGYHHQRAAARTKKPADADGPESDNPQPADAEQE